MRRACLYLHLEQLLDAAREAGLALTAAPTDVALERVERPEAAVLLT